MPTATLAEYPPGSPRARRRYTLYTAGIATAMVLVVYVMLGIWPFGDGSVVTGDLGGLYLNYYGHLSRFFHGEAGFAYGFDKGIGGSLVGLYAYYYASPLNWLYALVSERWFPVMAAFIFMVKTVLACVFFRVFIAAKYPKLNWRSVPLALCYGFMAYGFAYAQNIMWHDIVVLLPLICLGIDRIIAQKPATFYTVVLAIAILADFYIAYMGCIFAVIYFFYAMLTREKDPAAPLQPRWMSWRGPLGSFAAGSALAGGLSAVLLVPALVNVNANKGGLFDFAFSFETNFPLGRLPERFVWGSFAATDMEGHLPFVYCGLLVLVLVAAWFFSRSVPVFERLLSGGVLLFFLLSFWVKGLDMFWHGLKEPIWFPARYSFIFCFFLVFLAAKAVAVKAAGKNEVLLGGSVLFLALLVMTAFPIAVSRSRILLSAAAVILFTFCLMIAVTATSLRRRRLMFGVITVVVAVELAMNGYYISAGFDAYTLSSHQNRVDIAGGTIEAIQTADEGDYRIAENHFHSLNDPMLLGYRGLSHFGSTQDGWAQSVLYNLGLRNYEGGGPYLVGGTAFADGVLGLRYLSDGGGLPVSTHWQQSGIEAPMTVYENPYAMPMVFAIPGQNLTDGRTGEYEPDLFGYQNDLYTELGGVGELFTPVADVQLLDDGGNGLAPVGTLPPGATYQMTAAQSGQHYAWFESGTHLLTLYVNGQERELYFSPSNKGMIDLGQLAEGEVVTLAFSNSGDIQITAARFVRMDEAGLGALVEKARANAGTFTVRDGRVQGTITSNEADGWLFTSIPWDTDWQATVNGEKTELCRVAGGLLAVPLQAGENTVDLRFTPSGAGAGLAITLVSLAAFVALLVATALRRRRTADDKTTGEGV